MKLVVDGPNGAVPAYVYSGGKPFDPKLPCVVFIHGALHDHSVWTLLARWCAHHGYGALALDLPGHGRSEGPPLASVQAHADWLLALLAAAGVAQPGQATLVGHSMGSLIALEAAARAPDRIHRLVMVGSAYPMKVSAALLDTARDAPLKAIDMVNAFSNSTLAAKPSYPGPGMWLHGGNRALMRRVLNGPHVNGANGASGANGPAGRCEVNLFHHDFSVCDRYDNGLAAAAQVTAPTTMILGSVDQMTPPRAARELATALKAHIVLLPSGHNLLAEAPDGVLDALRDALA
ncbi:MAG: alpha/beta hydrolase [Microbacteriaceae bacterium]|nr:alpha/beta hydrolase [Burkholderiaceae bacterium]